MELQFALESFQRWFNGERLTSDESTIIVLSIIFCALLIFIIVMLVYLSRVTLFWTRIGWAFEDLWHWLKKTEDGRKYMEIENQRNSNNMRKILVTMIALALTIGAQAQQDDGLDAMMAAMIAAKIHQDSIDTSSLVAVYDYECQTQDADGKAVTDRMKVCLQVGQHCMRSFPYRKFREDTEGYDYMTLEELPLLKSEGYCFMPEVWTDHPEGKVTVRDAIPPTIYETQEERKPINWELSDDMLTVAGFLCKFATCQLHGRKWTALYSEDIPTSAGPWKLCGLPGLILKAETDDGIHRFTLASLQRIASPIYSETNAITSKTTEEKLIKNRIKTFGNRLYPKNPYYYITVNLNRTADVTSTNEGMIINNVFVNDKMHVYQPLELK